MKKRWILLVLGVILLFSYTNALGGTKTPIIVMIDNHKDARPQYGIGDADIVYEALAEGGITRFMAIFINKKISKIGPIRSAREYFVRLAYPYKGLYVHCGGSPYAYIAIKKLRIYDLDQLNHRGYFKRDHQKKAPHNLFTSSYLLQRAIHTFNISPPTRVPYFGALIKKTQDVEKSVKKIYIKYNSMYAITYKYENGRYVRYINNTKWKDALSNKPLNTDNLIILFIPSTLRKNDKAGRLKMNVNGVGRGILFTGGGMVSIKWVKHPKDPIFLMDKSGGRITLNPGKIWIEILPKGKGEVAYK